MTSKMTKKQLEEALKKFHFGPGPYEGGASLTPSEWTSPSPATPDVQFLCNFVRSLVEDTYNHGKPFGEFTATSFIGRPVKNGHIIRSKVRINTLAEIRLLIKKVPAEGMPFNVVCEAFCDGSLQDGPETTHDESDL
ncbi:uncharacterized protein LOC135822771 [Sycon ciliatum]|uniref:uncharacterized protein LOC135822771 n=1 Tax=Sycon ciliatum TaxID=27933 RepID=UPI0031F69BCC